MAEETTYSVFFLFFLSGVWRVQYWRAYGPHMYTTSCVGVALTAPRVNLWTMERTRASLQFGKQFGNRSV